MKAYASALCTSWRLTVLSLGTFDDAALAAYVALGITRVNLGVQSFDAAMLTGVC